MDVAFEAIDAERNRVVERRHRVLRPELGAPSVRDGHGTRK